LKNGLKSIWNKLFYLVQQTPGALVFKLFYAIFNLGDSNFFKVINHGQEQPQQKADEENRE
jgi:hypothetical protein